MELTKQYIAGFFDGEGSIGLYFNSRNGCSLRTQLTQNKGKDSSKIMGFLKEKYGGNLSEQKTLSGGIKYNWQLNADKSTSFLADIEPYLILKKKQAQLVILWQKQRPKRLRDARGRIVLSKAANKPLNRKVSEILKQMKKGMENAKTLVHIDHTLKQIVNVKGD